MSGGFRWREFARSLRILGDPAGRAGIQALAESRRQHRAIAAAFPRARIHPQAVFRGCDAGNTSVGDGVSIALGTLVYVERKAGAEGRIEIGAGTYIGEYNNLRATEGTRIAIGRKCLISQFCTLISANHGTRRGAAVGDQPCDLSRTGISLGNDVWLGAGVVVLPGADLGDGAVVGANSVILGSVPAYEIWAGAPARKVGERQ